MELEELCGMILARAAGGKVERLNILDVVWTDHIVDYWYEKDEYRVKKEKKKYRVAKLRNDNGGIYTSTCDSHGVIGEEQLTKWPHFIEWLTEWIEYE